MALVTFSSKGNFVKTDAYFKKLRSGQIYKNLQVYAEKGRAALAAQTPTLTGRAAQSWTAEVVHEGNTWSIYWSNTDRENGFPVAIALQYGYGTGTGGYIRGRDYINPAIAPIFEEISNSVWKEVNSA